MPDRPARLPGFAYCGMFRYHVRVETWDRQPHLANATTAAAVRAQLLRQADAHRFAVHAYCLMPDHAHVLLTGTSEASRLPAVVARWKQHTGYWFGRTFAGQPVGATSGCRPHTRLWQPGYFERVLREDEPDEVVARYIIANPLRAGLSEQVGQYPYAWCAWPIE